MELERWLEILAMESVVRNSTHMNVYYYGEYILEMKDVIISKTCLLAAHLLGQ